jgi:hypothetical protein
VSQDVATDYTTFKVQKRRAPIQVNAFFVPKKQNTALCFTVINHILAAIGRLGEIFQFGGDLCHLGMMQYFGGIHQHHTY